MAISAYSDNSSEGSGAPHQQHRADEDHSLTQGTSAWAGLGTPVPNDGNLEGGVIA